MFKTNVIEKLQWIKISDWKHAENQNKDQCRGRLEVTAIPANQMLRWWGWHKF